MIFREQTFGQQIIMLGILTNTKMSKILALCQGPCALTARLLLDRTVHYEWTLQHMRVIGIKEARKVG